MTEETVAAFAGFGFMAIFVVLALIASALQRLVLAANNLILALDAIDKRRRQERLNARAGTR